MSFIKKLGQNAATMGVGTAIDTGSQAVSSLINQAFAEHNRERNFYWNEKAAAAADKRQRKQYQDMYSPKAMLDQYAAAGLSPSLMMSGGQSAVGGNPSAAQGQGVQGAYPGMPAINPLAAAQIDLMKAQRDNLNEDTVGTELENEIRKLTNNQFKNQWILLNNQSGKLFDKDGKWMSMRDFLQECDNFDEFRKAVYKAYEDSPNIGNVYLSSEEGEKTLRSIYLANKEFDNDISVLANSKENADLMLKITQLLNDSEFATLSKKAQIGQLQQAIESTELSTEQKEAFNNVIDKMGDNMWADITIVLLMMLGQYSHVNMNFGASQSTMIKK